VSSFIGQVGDVFRTIGIVFWRGIKSLRENWGAGLLSLALAASLWVFVTDQEDPDVVGRVPGSIPVECVNVPEGRAASPPCLESTSVTVRVRAPESVLEDSIAEDFSAFADLSGVTGGQATVPVRVETTDSRVEIVETVPAEITVRLEDVTFRQVPIRANITGTPPRGFEAGDIIAAPEAAIITGAESLVSRIEAVEADVNLTGERASFEQDLLLVARDDLGANVTGVNIAPETATIAVEIIQTESTRTYAVRPDVTGVPAEGFSLSSIEVEPLVVNVTGTDAVFQALDPVGGIATAPVSIEGANADVVRTVGLQLPEGATVDQEQVTVRAIVRPTVAALSFEVPVDTENLAGNLDADLDVSTVRITLTGPLPLLAGVNAANITATVDLEGLAAGVHTVPVDVTPPAGLTAISVVPANVAATLTNS